MNISNLWHQRAVHLHAIRIDGKIVGGVLLACTGQHICKLL